jgi:hypothetical protein
MYTPMWDFYPDQVQPFQPLGNFYPEGVSGLRPKLANFYPDNAEACVKILAISIRTCLS